MQEGYIFKQNCLNEKSFTKSKVYIQCEVVKTVRRFQDKNIPWFTESNIEKRYQIGKRQSILAYMDSDLKYSPPSTTDWLSK